MLAYWYIFGVLGGLVVVDVLVFWRFYGRGQVPWGVLDGLGRVMGLDHGGLGVGLITCDQAVVPGIMSILILIRKPYRRLSPQPGFARKSIQSSLSPQRKYRAACEKF